MQFSMNIQVTFMYISYNYYLSPLYVLVNCTLVWFQYRRKLRAWVS